MHRRRRRTALLLSVAIAAAPLLTACGSDTHPGAAAVVGGQRITMAQLESRVNEVREAQRAAVADDAQYAQVLTQTSSLTRDTLHGMVLDRLMDRAAEDAGITVTPREVQQLRAGLVQQAGGVKGLETAWLQRYGIAPQRLDDNLRLQLEADKLATSLGTDTSQTAFLDVLSKVSTELGVDINPRYGSWNAKDVTRVDAKTPWVRDVTSAGTRQTT